jgi:hypothetical protein
MSNLKLFESKQIRSEWNESEQKWYFAIIDIIEILTESNNPRRYWSDLKRKLNAEGFAQLYEIIVQLKMISSDGKKYVTDCSDAKGLLRIMIDRLFDGLNKVCKNGHQIVTEFSD